MHNDIRIVCTAALLVEISAGYAKISQNTKTERCASARQKGWECAREGAIKQSRNSAQRHDQLNESAKIDVQKLAIKMNRACAAAS